MIEKVVSVFIPALNRTATTAIVKQIGLSFYVYDLFDSGGIVAQDRYSAIPTAPFSISQLEVDQWILDGGVILASDQTNKDGSQNYKAMIRRRAAKLPAIDAIILLKTIGE